MVNPDTETHAAEKGSGRNHFSLGKGRQGLPLRVHPLRLALAAVGLCAILLAFLFPMGYSATQDVIPALRDTKLTLEAGQSLTQTFQADASFTQISLLPSGLRESRDLTLDVTLERDDAVAASATIPLSTVKNNARIKLDFSTQQPGAYRLTLAATGAGTVKFGGSAGESMIDGVSQAAALGIRLMTTAQLYGTFPVYLGCLLLLISLVPISGRAAAAKRQPVRSPAAANRWLIPALTMVGLGIALLLAAHPEWVGVSLTYPQLVEGDIPAAVHFLGHTYHGPLFTMVFATWETLVLAIHQLTRREVALHRVVMILALGGGAVMGLCRPMLFEVGFDEGQHRLIMDQFAGPEAFTLPEGLYFSSSWNVGLLFHTLGRGMSTLLRLSAPWGYRWGGAISLLMYGLMASAAVRVAPKYKAAFALFALWPTNLFLAVTTTYDSLIVGGILLGTALLFRELHHRDQPLTLEAALLLLLTLSISTLAKSAYSLVLLMVLILPKEKFTSRKAAAWFRVLVVVIAVVCTLCRVAEFGLVLSSGTVGDDVPRNLTATQSREILLSGDERMDGTSSGAQWAAFQQNPLTGLGALARLIFLSLPRQSTEMAATYGYFGADPLSLWLWLVLLLTGPLMEQTAVRFSLRRRLCLLLMGLLPLVVLGVIMYFVSTPAGSPVVIGMQPRYLVPMVPLLFLALAHPLRLPHKASQWITRIGVGLAGGLLLVQGWIHLFLPFYT